MPRFSGLQGDSTATGLVKGTNCIQSTEANSSSTVSSVICSPGTADAVELHCAVRSYGSVRGVGWIPADVVLASMNRMRIANWHVDNLSTSQPNWRRKWWGRVTHIILNNASIKKYPGTRLDSYPLDFFTSTFSPAFPSMSVCT